MPVPAIDRHILSALALSIGVALTLGCGAGQRSDDTTNDLEPSVGPFHLEMTEAEAVAACESGGGRFVVPTAYLRTRGCHGPQLSIRGAPVDRYELTVNRRGVVVRVDAIAPRASARALAAQARRSGADLIVGQMHVILRLRLR